jgi:hypothetical protein
MHALMAAFAILRIPESRLFGFSARSGRIARACGLIFVTRGTGEKYFPAFRAQDVANASVGK